jgi:hypothetical protein
MVFDSVGGRRVLPHMYDGNYVVASSLKRPWRKQLNLLMGYIYFYNPIWLAVALLRRKNPVGLKPAGMQVVGMMGALMTIRRTFSWAIRLMFGRIERLSQAPQSKVPMRSVDGAVASHATFVTVPATPSRRGRALSLPVAG